MIESEDRPKIRLGLDYFPVQHEGQDMICLRDPLIVAPDAILVPPPAFFIIAQMDGENSILDIKTAFTKQYSQIIASEQVLELAATLKERGFLDGESFREKLKRVEEEYRQSPVRPSSHAGQAYPDSRNETLRFLDGLFDQIEVKNAGVPELTGGRVAGVIAPHIDLHRGGHLFARAYAALRDQPPPRTAVLFGTAHFGEGGPYILSAKDYETPLGRAPVDRAFCDRMIRSCSFDLTNGELAHRSEHSLEFQVLLLQYIYGESNMPPIVPILCTSFMDRLESGEAPASLPEVSEFLMALQETMKSSEGPVLLVAGADMCHVGRKFSTQEGLSPTYIEQVRREDREALEGAVEGGAEMFYECVARIANRNNICSVTSIYTLLKSLDGIPCRLLDYDMAVDPESDSAVGFAALNVMTPVSA